MGNAERVRQVFPACEGVAGVERSEPPVGRVSEGSLRSTAATLAWYVTDLELLNLGQREVLSWSTDFCATSRFR